jgi:hypothetical protein
LQKEESVSKLATLIGCPVSEVEAIVLSFYGFKNWLRKGGSKCCYVCVGEVSVASILTGFGLMRYKCKNWFWNLQGFGGDFFDEVVKNIIVLARV